MSFEYNLQLIDEEALVKECIKNNRTFQNQLYKIFAAKMMGVCMRYARTKEDAEDILQEGFIQVFTCMHQFKFKGNLEAWIRKIFINCALQKMREKENNYFFMDIYTLPDIQPMGYTEPDTIDFTKMIKCIQNLPLVCRLVFNLYVFEGFRHKEIASMLNISEGTSKSNLFDARDKLKKQLKDFNLLQKKVANE